MSEQMSFSLQLEQAEGFEFKVKFDWPGVAELLLDEPDPLGKKHGPNAARLVAAAVGNCLSASLVFCLQRHAKVQLSDVRARVNVEIVRNEQKRQRIGKVSVTIEHGMAEDDPALQKCREMFQDFCTVTESVRAGLDVEVALQSQA